jgi:hypothetical protein
MANRGLFFRRCSKRYEEAIRLARKDGCIQNEGLAYERAARFCKSRGFPTMADAYLRNARDCYVSWGRRREGAATRPALSRAERERAGTRPDGHDPGGPSNIWISRPYLRCREPFRVRSCCTRLCARQSSMLGPSEAC